MLLTQRGTYAGPAGGRTFLRMVVIRGYKILFTICLMSEISGFHGGKYEDDCLLGCCAV
jgi:hypothetical protein